MANRPANAGSGSGGLGSGGLGSVGLGSVGLGRGLAPVGDVAPPLDATAPPQPVHHVAAPRAGAPRAAAPRAEARQAAVPRAPAGHRAARPRPSRESRASRASREPRGAGPSGNRAEAGTSGLAWLPYLIVLAGVGAGMFVAWQGSKYAGRGTGLVGCSLLAAALARLILPARYAGLLSSRRKASDVLAFAVFGAAVLAVALTLP